MSGLNMWACCFTASLKFHVPNLCSHTYTCHVLQSGRVSKRKRIVIDDDDDEDFEDDAAGEEGGSEGGAVRSSSGRAPAKKVGIWLSTSVVGCRSVQDGGTHRTRERRHPQLFWPPSGKKVDIWWPISIPELLVCSLGRRGQLQGQRLMQLAGRTPAQQVHIWLPTVFV